MMAEPPRTVMEFKRQSTGGLSIDSYGDGGFRIDGRWYDGPVLVLPDAVHPWAARSPEEVSIDGLGPILDCEPGVEILLFGLGRGFAVPPAGVRESLAEAGISADPMDTGAAARTYNVLLLESRRVAAALLPF